MKNLLLTTLIMFFVATAFAQKTTVRRNKNGVTVKITSNKPIKNVRIGKHGVSISNKDGVVVINSNGTITNNSQRRRNQNTNRSSAIVKDRTEPLNNNAEEQDIIADIATISTTEIDLPRTSGENSTVEHTTTVDLASPNSNDNSSHSRYETASSNSGKQLIYQDKYGARTGSASTDSQGNTTYQDRYGTKVGSATTDSQGNTIYQDKYGVRTGSASTDSQGNTIYQDKYGVRTGSASTDSQGNTIYQDKYGVRIGSSTVDASGNITFKDKYGVAISKPPYTNE